MLALFTTTLWLFNPHFIVRYEYSLFDTIQIFFLLLSLILSQKRPALSGFFYALAVSFKLTPIMFLPLIMLVSSKPKLFLNTLAATLVLVILPFFKSAEDFDMMLRGSVFVHTARNIQGRPLLSYIQHTIGDDLINFRQNSLFGLYTALAILLGPIVATVLFITNRCKNIYILCLICSISYYLFTPILNRTHVLWFFPLFLIGFYEATGKSALRYVILSASYFLVLSLYLVPWSKGMVPVSPRSDNYKVSSTKQLPFEKMKSVTISYYYDIRHRLFENAH